MYVIARGTVYFTGYAALRGRFNLIYSLYCGSQIVTVNCCSLGTLRGDWFKVATSDFINSDCSTDISLIALTLESEKGRSSIFASALYKSERRVPNSTRVGESTWLAKRLQLRAAAQKGNVAIFLIVFFN
jgi:hypothetical protein